MSTSFSTALIDSSIRRGLYFDAHGRCGFLNPLYVEQSSATGKGSSSSQGEQNLSDFLASMPSFADFSTQQLSVLVENAVTRNFAAGDVIFKQGDDGDVFYIIHKGTVEVLIQKDPQALAREDYGQQVTKLNTGFFFGERALLTTEPRAATIRATESTDCLIFSRDIFEEVISGSDALLGEESKDNVDWSNDHETRSLCRHVEKILGIENDTSMKPRIKNILYELSTAFTPELTVDEIVARMVMTVKSALKTHRVGLFILTEDKRNMVLKVSERSKGIRLPVRGLAGSVAESNASLSIPDAYQDSRFDATMDRRTGYRTRQVLCVPVRNPLSQECIGVLQVNNRIDGGFAAFSEEELMILELAANQLSEILHGRADIFIQTGPIGQKRSLGQGSGDGIIVTSSCDSTLPFTVHLISVSQRVDKDEEEDGDVLSRRYVDITVSLHLGLGQLCQSKSVSLTFPTNPARDTRGNIVIPADVKIQFDITNRDLPRACRLLFRTELKKVRNNKLVSNCWAGVPLYDFTGCLETYVDVNFFEGTNEVPINTTLSNNGKNCPGNISAVLASDVVFQDNATTPRGRLVHCCPKRLNPIQVDSEELSQEDAESLRRIYYLSFDPLGVSKLSNEDKDFIWNVRYNIVNRADLLPAFVMSVRWDNAERVQELYDLLDIWEAPKPLEALQLLDRKFMDPKVRAYAVHCIEELKDEELSLYMLQLVQQLKFENHVDSALSRLLLRRSLKNKRVIGHIYFWLLQSEVYNVDVKARFTALLQIYLRNCGQHRVELGQQMYVMKRLEAIALKVVQGESKAERKQILHKQLEEAVLPSQFQLPLDPHLRASGFCIEKCRVMESKKKPLWLNLTNGEEGENFVLMLKVGDDLRQDALILQLLKIMNDLWKKEGLDMQMMIYGCISTGDERGLLEVVLNSSTLGGVLLDATDKDKDKDDIKSGSMSRKISSAMRALNDYDVLKEWIWNNVRARLEGESEMVIAEEMENCIQNFIVSTAAYCVASFVLGLGDRHNDNLMITKDAKFFHIDFGHILGNFKSKYGIKRERAPMVFTHAMKNVMKPEQYSTFVDLCCDIFNILRKHSSLLVSLFSLSIPCNLPELQEEKDVQWIYEKLQVGKNDEEGAAYFRDQLELSLNTAATRMNDVSISLKSMMLHLLLCCLYICILTSLVILYIGRSHDSACIKVSRTQVKVDV